MESSSKKRNWYEFGIYGALLYQLTPYFYMDKLNGLTIETYSNYLLFDIPPITIILLIIFRMYGAKDFRFKVAINTLAAIMSALLVILILAFEGQFDRIILPESDFALVYGLNLLAGMIITTACILSISSLINPIESAIKVLSDEVEDGNLIAQITSSKVLEDGIFEPIARFINKMVETTGRSLVKITEASMVFSTTAEQLASSSEEVNASAEEVSSTSQSMATGATQQVELIEQVVKEMDEANTVIDDIIQKIQRNTETVSQIALQTNILALNAGIEASRAGDYGRGFAVVAENVRKLSDESKNSADQISEVVETISNTLKTVFSSMQTNILTVVAVSEETAASAEEVAAAAEEMTGSMEEISSLAQLLAGSSEED